MARRQGGTWFVLNDAGQVPFAQISALLPLRRGDLIVNPISQEALQVPDSFRLVLTMNRENGSCRNNLTAMESLNDGGLVIDVPDPGDAEIRAILKAKLPGLTKAMLDRLLKIRARFHDLANKEGDRQKVNVGVRAMLQLATLLRAGVSENSAVRMAVVGKFLLHKDKYDAAMLTNDLA